ncbi:GNAT family N-acetyltransferase [Chitinophaga sp. Cy-1792]|uniref:GNAT family N-acetyltransferase n=1 Tax=Chitinophaga sp. Cy-1792 TaxID=2608339 RepID=UPI00141F32C3|nr:GNAT family N-acetyltransferase [Chitinophaga sp. Cy-1792]NIG56016.1 GNAT family N-acetyltransferase [Chitinophaga sp. Cy-1792]
MKQYLFTSPRLGFRQWLPEDTLPFAAINADPVAMEFFPMLMTEEETRNMIARMQQHFDQYGYGLYAVDLLETGQFIGFVGFNHPQFEAWFTPCVEIGWRLAPAVWNNGYATEAAIRCFEYAFEELGLKDVYAFTTISNKKSERIMQKAGMQHAGFFDHPKLAADHPFAPHTLYRITTPTSK